MSAETLGPIRNQAIEQVATAPLTAAMIHSNQDIPPIPPFGVCESAAAPKLDSSAGATVLLTMVVAAGEASLPSAPCALGTKPMSLAYSGEATRLASSSVTGSLIGAVTCGAPCVMSLEAA